jgi:23S rRNA (adenine2503-C2)-methyltransferase
MVSRSRFDCQRFNCNDRDGMTTPSIKKPLIYDYSYNALEKILLSWDEPSYRVKQIWNGLYCNYWNSADEFTNLPISLRNRLGDLFSFRNLSPKNILESKDRETRKTLFMLPDGQAVEAVLMLYNRRRTLCISTQAGCAMGCVFCATGQMGFRRNLSSGEIVEQVLYYARHLSETGDKVTNVVVMGMGEPFHNYDATMAAIDVLNHPLGFNLGSRKFTISTVGLIPAIHRFARERRQVNLAISLHAAEDDLRNSLLPINRKYPLDDLFAACQKYVSETNRRISFEWALIRGINDSPDQAHKLAKRLRVFIHGGVALCHVNIIPLNPTHKFEGEATSKKDARIFQSVLEQSGIPCTIRLRRGIDIQAGCGQLAIQAG